MILLIEMSLICVLFVAFIALFSEVVEKVSPSTHVFSIDFLSNTDHHSARQS